MSKTLKLAFVGCGAIAPYHLNGIKEHAPASRSRRPLTPTAPRPSRSRPRRAPRCSARWMRGLAHGDFDAVDVLTPHHLHEPLAIQAFAGRQARRPGEADGDHAGGV